MLFFLPIKMLNSSAAISHICLPDDQYSIPFLCMTLSDQPGPLCLVVKHSEDALAEQQQSCSAEH